MQHWDYGWNAPYFITICTQHRTCYFGEIINEEMRLSVLGEIAYQCWMEIPLHFPHIHLGAFVVMPNHVHGVIVIDKPNNGANTINNNGVINTDGTTIMVETGHALSLQTTTSSQHNQLNNSIGKNRFQNIGKNSLSSIIGSYKSAVAKNAHRMGFNFVWQTRFHEHVIRNHESFVRIEQYIIENPAKWDDDQSIDL
jgi:REP element-mobilizing transposase RayT